MNKGIHCLLDAGESERKPKYGYKSPNKGKRTLLDILSPDNEKKSAAGRSKGVHNKDNVDQECKTVRINMRATKTTKKRLQWIHDNSTKYNGLSDSDIIEKLIEEHVVMQEFFNEHLPRF